MHSYSGKKLLILRSLFVLGLSVSSGAMAACSTTSGVPVSVKNCGADDTGGSASDAAFVDALAAAVTNGSYAVHIPCGLYSITSATLTIPSNGFTISGGEGCAAGTATVQLSSSYVGPFIQSTGKSDLSIRNFKIASSGTNNTKAIKVTPPATGATNLRITSMWIEHVGVAVYVGTLDTPTITDGLFISDSRIADTAASSVVIQNVSNFHFVGNTVANWNLDGINYDMTVDVANWRITGNNFNAGTEASHAISQGPDHPARQIQGAVFAGNVSTTGPGGYVGKGAGFGIECSDCQIVNNSFTSDVGSSNNGWRNCLEIYGSANVTVSGNRCNAGFLLAGPTFAGTDVQNFRISNNDFKSVGAIPNNTMTCINFGGNAGGTPAAGARTTATNVDIVSNKCDATQTSGTGGTIGIVFGNHDWAGLNNVRIADNTITQVTTNQAIRILGPVTSLTKVRVTNNVAPQGFAFYSPNHALSTPWYTVPNASQNVISWNDFHLTPTRDESSPSAFTFSDNL